jgi:hypothetical protein
MQRRLGRLGVVEMEAGGIKGVLFGDRGNFILNLLSCWAVYNGQISYVP